MATDHDEILRLRDRVDTLTQKVIGLEYLTGSQGKGIGYLRDEIRSAQMQLEGLEDKVAGMNHAEQIAAAVTAALRQSQRSRWTTWQKVGTGAFAALLGVPTIVEIARWFV